MATTGSTNNFSEPAQGLVDKVANKAQTGILAAQNAALAAGDKVADTVESIRSGAAQGMDTATAAVKKVTATTSQFSDSLVSYTKENPVKALLLSALAGAVFLILLKGLSPSRD